MFKIINFVLQNIKKYKIFLQKHTLTPIKFKIISFFLNIITPQYTNLNTPKKRTFNTLKEKLCGDYSFVGHESLPTRTGEAMTRLGIRIRETKHNLLSRFASISSLIAQHSSEEPTRPRSIIRRKQRSM